MTLQCFLTKFEQNFPTVQVNLKIFIVVMVGAYIVTPTARGRDFPAFFPPSLWSCVFDYTSYFVTVGLSNMVQLRLWEIIQ